MARLEHQVEVTGFMEAAVELTLEGLGTAAVRAVKILCTVSKMKSGGGQCQGGLIAMRRIGVSTVS